MVLLIYTYVLQDGLSLLLSNSSKDDGHTDASFQLVYTTTLDGVGPGVE